MTDIMRSPDRRIEDFQAILKGRDSVDGMTKFGDASISKFNDGYSIDIASNRPDMRIYFVIDGSGMLKDSGRYFMHDSGAEPRSLTPAEKQMMDEPIYAANQMIDEILATFQEDPVISSQDKEIAAQEESEKIAEGVRNKVVSILSLDTTTCKVKSNELPVKEPSEVAPSVVNSFTDQEWRFVIERVINTISKEEDTHKAA